MTMEIDSSQPRLLDVLVVGAGQAGLAMGYHLRQQGLTFQIVESAEALGSAWRSRWDSLRLFTPAEFDSLPGSPFPAPTGSYPGKDQVADYLTAYAATHALPVRLGTHVTRLEWTADGFLATTTAGAVRARQVVIAAGPWQRPFVPNVGASFASSVQQLHSAEYRNPGQLPPGSRVLVVGGGNSGLQIAAELARTHEVTLSVGSRPPRLPQQVFGRDLFFWLDRTGLMRVPATSRLARRVQAKGDVVIGGSLRRLRAAGVTVRSRLVTATAHTAGFDDGAEAEIDTVVWATGFRSDYRWLDIEGVLVGGSIRHRNGVTDVAGLYVIGLPWQSTRGSALLGFVAADAEPLARVIRAAAIPRRVGEDRPHAAAR